jgi:hypothetical protein
MEKRSSRRESLQGEERHGDRRSMEKFFGENLSEEER